MSTIKLIERDRRLGPSPRSVHLIDIENLAGCTDFRPGSVAIVAAEYRRVAEVLPRDLLVMASSHFTAPAAWFGWPDTRRVVRSGPDGADMALIRIIETENLSRRFDRVVVASGDGIFAGNAARLQAEGCAVTVVSRRRALSRELRLAVLDVRYLDVEPEPASLVVNAREVA